jgi:hypothetical protein
MKQERKPMIIEKPLVLMFEADGKVVTHIHPGSHNYQHYGLLICDLVRHGVRHLK